MSVNALAGTQQSLGHHEQAIQLWEETQQHRKTAIGENNHLTLWVSSHLTRSLLAVERFADAETLMRDCLPRWERVQPDSWKHFYARSQLGSALLGQEKYDEAEPLLLSGYQGMKERSPTIRVIHNQRPLEALESLLKLYAATNQPDRASQTQRELNRQLEALNE